jgi:hypothetical protein
MSKATDDVGDVFLTRSTRLLKSRSHDVAFELDSTSRYGMLLEV